jgi:cytochrome c oxidase subunit 1
MAGIFGLFAATYYWFPLICGRLMHESLGRWHFWLTLIGAYATFVPMHLAGLGGNPRHYAQLDGIANAASTLLANVMPTQRFITWAVILLTSAQVLFVINLVFSFRSGKRASANPWLATTLEWAPDLSPDQDRIVHCSPCVYLYGAHGDSIQGQWVQVAKAE